jgi:hypothetical protein
MNDHSQWADTVGAYLLGALEPDEAERFEAHLADCPVCRRDVEDLRVAADALPVSVPLIRPPAALKDRIMSVVNEEAELLAAAGRRADEAGERPPAEDRSRAVGRRRRSGGRSLGGWLLRPGPAARARTVIAQTRAPDADVRLEIHEDGSMLVAENMPAPPSGRIYQVWLKRPGKDPEPTSVLWSTRGDGSAEVAVPGSLEGVEAVLVTDEPPGGSEEPTKPPVITAETA